MCPIHVEFAIKQPKCLRGHRHKLIFCPSRASGQDCTKEQPLDVYRERKDRSHSTVRVTRCPALCAAFNPLSHILICFCFKISGGWGGTPCEVTQYMTLITKKKGLRPIDKNINSPYYWVNQSAEHRHNELCGRIQMYFLRLIDLHW